MSREAAEISNTLVPRSPRSVDAVPVDGFRTCWETTLGPLTPGTHTAGASGGEVEGEGLAAVVAEGAVLVSVCLVVLVHADATNRTATRAARAARCRAVALGTRMDEDPIRSTRSRLLILPITILPRSAGGGETTPHSSLT